MAPTARVPITPVPQHPIALTAMPFTLSHAAVAIPLARRGLILSAVAIGSMAPDFEYFLRLSMNSRWGHTPAGILGFTLPVSLLALWSFHALLKRPLLALLPEAHRTRLLPFAGRFAFAPAGRFLRILASVGIGIASHLLFDAWTHDHGRVVETWALLRQPLLDWPAYRLPVYDVMQAGLSSLMLLAIGVQYWAWFRRTGPTPASLREFLDVRSLLVPVAAVATVAVLCGLGYAAISAPPVRDAITFRIFGGRVILAGLSAFAAGLVVLGWWRERTAPAQVGEEAGP